MASKRLPRAEVASGGYPRVALGATNRAISRVSVGGAYLRRNDVEKAGAHKLKAGLQGTP